MNNLSKEFMLNKKQKQYIQGYQWPPLQGYHWLGMLQDMKKKLMTFLQGWVMMVWAIYARKKDKLQT